MGPKHLDPRFAQTVALWLTDALVPEIVELLQMIALELKKRYLVDPDPPVE